MAFVAGLGSGMGLVALVAGFHRRTVGPGSSFVMGHVSVAVDAQNLLVGMLLMGNPHDPQLIQAPLFLARDGGVAAHASIVHQFIAG
jgi:hypothetical protein